MSGDPAHFLFRALSRPPYRWLVYATLLGAACLSACLGSGLATPRHLTIRVDGRALPVAAAVHVVSEALLSSDVTLEGRDIVSPPLDTPVTDGMVVTIRRAKPITFLLDGKRVTIRSTARTVGKALEESRLSVRPGDRLSPGREALVGDGLEVTVTRMVHTYRHREDPIPFETVRREDMTMEVGQTAVVRAGAEGLIERVFAVTLEDGVEVSSRELSSSTICEPVSRIVRVGTAGTAVLGGEAVRFLKAVRVRATAYEPGPISCGESADGYTAVGLKATKGIVAVDPGVIPLWTRLYVEGYGYAVAGDVGSAIKGQRIDVCFDTLGEALTWGVKYVTVYILELPAS